MTYSQQYGYNQNSPNALGTFNYDLRYTRQLGADQQWSISGQYIGYEGESLQAQNSRGSDYRIETDFRLTF